MITSFPRATLLYTETRSFFSSIMGSTYQISTWFPSNYPDGNRKYPVIYLLDGDLFIGLVSGIVSGLIWGQVIPECLVVGIGHEIDTFDEWWNTRAVDFNPPENPEVVYPEWMQPFTNRRAPDFLSFLKLELIPFVSRFIRSIQPIGVLPAILWVGNFRSILFSMIQNCFRDISLPVVPGNICFLIISPTRSSLPSIENPFRFMLFSRLAHLRKTRRHIFPNSLHRLSSVITMTSSWNRRF